MEPYLYHKKVYTLIISNPDQLVDKSPAFLFWDVDNLSRYILGCKEDAKKINPDCEVKIIRGVDPRKFIIVRDFKNGRQEHAFSCIIVPTDFFSTTNYADVRDTRLGIKTAYIKNKVGGEYVSGIASDDEFVARMMMANASGDSIWMETSNPNFPSLHVRVFSDNSLCPRPL